MIQTQLQIWDFRTDSTSWLTFQPSLRAWGQHVPANLGVHCRHWSVWINLRNRTSFLSLLVASVPWILGWHWQFGFGTSWRVIFQMKFTKAQPWTQSKLALRNCISSRSMSKPWWSVPSEPLDFRFGGVRDFLTTPRVFRRGRLVTGFLRNVAKRLLQDEIYRYMTALDNLRAELQFSFRARELQQRAATNAALAPRRPPWVVFFEDVTSNFRRSWQGHWPMSFILGRPRQICLRLLCDQKVLPLLADALATHIPIDIGFL